MRVKTGYTRRKRHKKILKRTKGFWMTKGRLYKVSKEADLHAGQYAFIGRKLRKRDFRRLWITRISAAAKLNGTSYSAFIGGLERKGIALNRKILADIAVQDVSTFTALAEMAKEESVKG